MTFWDHMSAMTVLAIRDYFHEKEQREKRLRQFNQDCKETIGKKSSELFERIISVMRKANPNYMPEEIVSGGKLLPVYAFYLVVRAQGGRPTREQSEFVDMYLRTIPAGFSFPEFLAAVTGPDASRKRLEESVALTDDKVGAFWKTFFKAVFVASNDEKGMQDINDLFAEIVMNFSVLGNLKSQLALPICDSFIRAMQKQATISLEEPPEAMDFLGEMSAAEHRKQMDKIGMSLLYAAGEQDELELDELLPFFYIGTVMGMLGRSRSTETERAQMLNRVISDGLLPGGFTGQELYNQMRTRSGAYRLLADLPDQILPIIMSLALKARRMEEGTKFITECVSFLSGVEKELAQAYPRAGFGRLTQAYMEEEIQAVSDLTR